MMRGDTDSMEAWLSTRPQEIQDLAKRYPPGSRLTFRGETLHLIGYGETAGGPVLLVSPIDPCDDYEGSISTKMLLHPECYEKESP